MSKKLYGERNLDTLEGMETYAKHIEAMTAEGLNSKSDIAAELAYRDDVIDAYNSLLIDIKNLCEISIERSDINLAYGSLQVIHDTIKEMRNEKL